jgi:hypothetical protein
MQRKPRSAHDKAGGMAYFPRMLDKIRLQARGELHPDYHANLGQRADGWCLDFLRMNYPDLKARVQAGGTDEEVLHWCQENGRKLNGGDLNVWNAYILKLGWRDAATERLQKSKAENGLGHRDDILTMPDFFDADEGRNP